MSRSIVFLDIDGVLNNSVNYHRWHQAWDERAVQNLEDGLDRWTANGQDPFVDYLFDPEMVARLNKITRMCDADIVVSSSWRLHYADKFDELREIMRRCGIEAEILGPTPTDVEERGTAIEKYLNVERAGEEVSFVILDDEYHDVFGRLKDRLVRTIGYRGLTDADVADAIATLDSPGLKIPGWQAA